MRSLNHLRDRKAQLRKELKINQKGIGLDLMSLRWNLLMDLGLDFFGMFMSKSKSKGSVKDKESESK